MGQTGQQGEILVLLSVKMRPTTITENKKTQPYLKIAFFVAVWTGFEPATSAVTGRHSNQLNYQTFLMFFSSFSDVLSITRCANIVLILLMTIVFAINFNFFSRLLCYPLIIRLKKI